MYNLEPMTKRTRNYCFLKHADDTILEDSIDCQYIIYLKLESGMLQGFICFKKEKSLSRVRCLFGTPDILVSSNFDEDIEFLKKQGDYTERGKRPMSQKRKGEVEIIKWKEILIAAQEGRFEDIPEEFRFKNIRLIEYHRKKHLLFLKHRIPKIKKDSVSPGGLVCCVIN